MRWQDGGRVLRHTARTSADNNLLRMYEPCVFVDSYQQASRYIPPCCVLAQVGEWSRCPLYDSVRETSWRVDKVFVKSSTYFLIYSQWSLCEAILSSYGTISNIIQHTEAWRKRRCRAWRVKGVLFPLLSKYGLIKSTPNKKKPTGLIIRLLFI